MRQISRGGLRSQSQCRMPPATDPDGPAALIPACSLLFHAPTFCTLAPMVMSAFRSSLFVRTQLFLRKGHSCSSEIQPWVPPFPAVPYESRPSLPRECSCVTACTGMQTGRLFTQEISFRGHQLGTWCLQIKVWELGDKLI